MWFFSWAEMMVLSKAPAGSALTAVDICFWFSPDSSAVRVQMIILRIYPWLYFVVYPDISVILWPECCAHEPRGKRGWVCSSSHSWDHTRAPAFTSFSSRHGVGCKEPKVCLHLGPLEKFGHQGMMLSHHILLLTTEWLGLEGIFKILCFQLPWHGQGWCAVLTQTCWCINLCSHCAQPLVIQAVPTSAGWWWHCVLSTCNPLQGTDRAKPSGAWIRFLTPFSDLWGLDLWTPWAVPSVWTVLLVQTPHTRVSRSSAEEQIKGFGQ